MFNLTFYNLHSDFMANVVSVKGRCVQKNCAGVGISKKHMKFSIKSASKLCKNERKST